MGMFTEIYVNVDLREDLPDHAHKVLRAICQREDEDFNSEVIDAAKLPYRWAWLFCDGSYYLPKTHVAHLTYDRIGRMWSLLGKGDIKNYDDEIEQFFEWLAPRVEPDHRAFIGYLRYEEALAPTLVYVRDGKAIFIPPKEDNYPQD